MADEGFSLPDDAFVQILPHLPTSARRRFRLVCKRWRDMINERTPEMQVGTKILAFVNKLGCSRAIVFDKKDGRRRRAWTYPCSHERSSVAMVGTCNGLLCLHESMTTSVNGGFSTIVVTNPITGETVALPPAPKSWEWEQMGSPGKYSFGYHPTTGRYKVVHIATGRREAVDALQVFTLGDTSWREVPVTGAPDVSYDRRCEAISVDGRTYWLDASSIRVMALDLKDERVTSFAAPPAAVCPSGLIPVGAAGWELTNVHGRLGAVVATAMSRVEVWVLDDNNGGGGAPARWSRRYDIVEATTSGYWIAAPQLIHGDYILRASRDREHEDFLRIYPWGMRRLYRCKLGDLADGDDEQPRAVKGRELVMSTEESIDGDLRTFAYVERSRAVAECSRMTDVVTVVDPNH